MAPQVPPEVAALLARSNRLGSDPRNTNYAGGNASAKGPAADPVTGQQAELLWVKGSGGDLGTLTADGLAVLRLDRLRALTDVYPGVEREDEMVAAFDYCLHGKGGAAPSIDTAMHGLLDPPHVDHLHPDSGIALATAADGERLTRECFGGRVAWVPWRRPGFQLGLDIAAIAARPSGPDRGGTRRSWHHRMGRLERPVRGQVPGDHRHGQRYLDASGRRDPFGPEIPAYLPLPEAAAPGPRRGPGPGDPRARLDRPASGRALHRHPGGARLPGPPASILGSRRSAPHARTISCAPRCGRWCSTCRRRHRCPR